MAAPTSSISGLVSGLDTSTIISQLMQIESQGQTTLKTRLTTQQSTVSALQDVNALFSTLATTAGDLATTSAWNPLTVTSSSTTVAATAAAGAVPGSLTFTVGSLAAAHQLTFASSAAMSAPVADSGALTLTLADGTTKSVTVGDGTLGSVINGLNAAGTGVKASTVRLDDGTYRLQVTSTTTGAAGQFTLTNADGTDILGGGTVSRQGTDAAITVGTDTLHSASNTFPAIAGGLTITLGTGTVVGSTVTLDATQDVDAMTAKVKGFVDAINAALKKIGTQTAYDPTTKQSGALSGQGAVTDAANALLEAVLPSDGTSLAGVGIQLDRYGNVTFDEDAFRSAYAADPSGTAAKFVTAPADPGFAARIQAVAKSVSDPVSGTLTSSLATANSGIRDLQDQIAAWDVRLQLKQESLQTQFTNLETTLSQLNSQSSWLSGQLASLTKSSSSSSSS